MINKKNMFSWSMIALFFLLVRLYQNSIIDPWDLIDMIYFIFLFTFVLRQYISRIEVLWTSNLSSLGRLLSHVIIKRKKEKRK